MEGPTHLAAGYLAKITLDTWVFPRLPPRIRKIVEYPVVIGGCFLLHGLMDLFAKLTAHDDHPGTATISLLVFYGLVFILMGREWIWGKERWWHIFSIGRWRNSVVLIASWWLVDCEHPIAQILNGRVGYNRNFPYPIHDAAEWIWLQIPGFNEFLSKLPVCYQKKETAFFEIGLMCLILLGVYLVSNRQHLKDWLTSIRKPKSILIYKEEA